MSRIRRALGPDAVRSTAGGYTLDVVDVDARRFESMAVGELARDARGSDAITKLSSALDLWRGDVLADLGDPPFVSGERRRLHELRDRAIEGRLAAMVDVGRHDEAIVELGAFVHAHPLNERARATYMLALYRAGRQADALATYHDYRRSVDDELGIEPAPMLTERYREILMQESSLGGAPVRRDEPAAHVPRPPTSFIGRRREIENLLDLMTTTPLLTLLGPGGSGKTRLALELAHATTRGGRDAWYVALEDLDDPALVGSTIALAIGARSVDDQAPADAIAARLRDADGLLVLDNCEHLVDAVAAAVDRIVAIAPAVTILATSRVRLRSAVEVTAIVPPMTVPDLEADPDAILAADGPRLFVERARAANASLAIGPQDASHLAAICSAVDGLPLGVELAAGLTRILPLDRIAARMAADLDVSPTADRDVPGRQASLRATARWSVDLLPPDARRLLGRLTVFAGRFDLDAVEAVCTDEVIPPSAVLALLIELADRSLVARLDEEPGLRLLTTIRAFARDEVADPDELDALRDRHARHHLALARAGSEPMDDQAMSRWIRSIGGREDDLRAVLAWATSGGGDPALGLAVAVEMGRVWEWRGQATEGAAIMERLLPLASAAPADIRSSAYMWLAYYRWRTAAIEAGKDAVEAALASAEDASDPGGRAGALGVLSLLLRDGGDTQGAEDRAREAHRIWSEVGDPWAVAYADILSARAAVAGERLAAAEGYVAAATARYEELGFGRGTMWADVTIALIRLGEGRWPEARSHARRALEAARQLGDPDSEVESLDVLVAVARQRGEMTEATELEAAANRIRRTTAPRTRGRTGEGITSPR